MLLKIILILFSLCLIPLFLNPAFAVNSLENANLEGKNSIISLDIEFGEDTVKHTATKSITVHHLDKIFLTFYGDEIFLADPELRMAREGDHFRISSAPDGIIMYGHKNMDKGNYDVNVYIATDKGLVKFPVTVSVPTSVPTSVPIIEKKVIPPIEEPEEEKKIIPDLMMTSSHDFRTYWKEMFDVEVQSFDGNINPKPKQSSFEGRLGGADVNVIISLDDEHVVTLPGITSDRGHWAGQYFIEENITPPGEYTVDVVLTHLGKTVSKTSSMFIIASTSGGGDSSVFPVANAGPDQFVDYAVVVTLDGSQSAISGSAVPGQGILTYTWIQISGTQVVLSDNTASSPTFTSPGADTDIVFQLAVTNLQTRSDSDTVQIQVRDLP